MITPIRTLRAAFVHVMADAAVSVLVIVGLVVGREFGWIWMDPLMGIIATIVIMSWSWSLVRAAGAVLLDVSPDPTLSSKIAARLACAAGLETPGSIVRPAVSTTASPRSA
jgi:Co/Zn/Cd efflux system component